MRLLPVCGLRDQSRRHRPPPTLRTRTFSLPGEGIGPSLGLSLPAASPPNARHQPSRRRIIHLRPTMAATRATPQPPSARSFALWPTHLEIHPTCQLRLRLPSQHLIRATSRLHASRGQALLFPSKCASSIAYHFSIYACRNGKRPARAWIGCAGGRDDYSSY
jgi:hypothetical protein